MSATSRGIFGLAMIFTLLAVLGGALVCATESGMACPTWPGCFPDQLLPGLQLPAWIEMTHRLVSAACLILLVMAATTVWSHQDDPLVRWLPWVAVFGALGAAVLGMSIIFWGLPKWLAMFDLLCSLISLIAITWAWVASNQGSRASWTLPAKVGGLALLGLVLVHTLGILVAGTNSLTRCLSWPLVGLFTQDGAPWLQLTRLVLAGAVVLGVSWLAMTGKGAWVTFALIAIEVALGAVIAGAGPTPVLGATYSLIAVLAFFSLVVVGAKAALTTSG